LILKVLDSTKKRANPAPQTLEGFYFDEIPDIFKHNTVMWSFSFVYPEVQDQTLDHRIAQNRDQNLIVHGLEVEELILAVIENLIDHRNTFGPIFRELRPEYISTLQDERKYEILDRGELQYFVDGSLQSLA